MPAPRSGRRPRRRPQLQRRPPLHAVLAVLGREQRFLELDRGARRDRRAPRRPPPSPCSRPPARQGGGERQQAAVGEDDADRPPQDLDPVAHRPAAYLIAVSCPIAIRRRRPRPRRRRLRGDLRAARRGQRRLLRGTGAERGRARRRGSSATPPPTPGSSPSAGERWSATPTHCLHRAPRLPLERSSVSVYIAAGRARQGHRPRPLRGALRAPARARLPHGLRRHHPAQRGQRRPPREPRLRARSASTARSAGRKAPGATSAGSSWSWPRPPAPTARRRSRADAPATIGHARRAITRARPTRPATKPSPRRTSTRRSRRSSTPSSGSTSSPSASSTTSTSRARTSTSPSP